MELMDQAHTSFRDRGKDIVVFYNKNELPHISIPHLHSGYEVYYNISGAKGFMVNGEFLKCGSHDLIVIPKVQAHKVLVKKNVPYERCIINVSDGALEMIQKLSPCPIDLSWLTGHHDGAPLTGNLNQTQHEAYLQMIHSYNAYEQVDGMKALAVFAQLLAFLRERFEQPERTEYLDSSEITYSDLVLQQIEFSFKTASVSEITDKVFVCEDYANRLFRKETGMTIKQYLTIRKIAEAKKFLFLGKSVKEACLLSGFGNYANFIRTFKKYEGFSPGELEELTQPL